MLTHSTSLAVRNVSVETVRTFVAEPGESCAMLLTRVARTLAHFNEAPLMLMVFGRTAATRDARRMMRELPGGGEWPMLVVEGEPCHDGAMAGVQAFVVRNSCAVRRVCVDGRVVGSIFEDGDARHCVLAGLGPAAVTGVEGVQTQETFAQLERALREGGFTFADIARTWFYNRNILAWYDEFNRVRSAFYRKQAFRGCSSPASTGIEGNNPEGAALAMAVWAVRPLNERASVKEVVSPLQCPAPAYGSTFSRAVEISSGGQRRVLVSGTASIAPGGESVWAGNPVKQIALTMEVIGAILRSRGMDLDDVTRASAYFKYAEDRGHFQAWLLTHGFQYLPYVAMHCDVCRDDLLFELELDACRPAADSSPALE